MKYYKRTDIDEINTTHAWTDERKFALVYRGDIESKNLEVHDPFMFEANWYKCADTFGNKQWKEILEEIPEVDALIRIMSWNGQNNQK